MFTADFWKQAIERAVKTAAQAVILFLGADQAFDVVTVNWGNALGIAAGGAVLSLLTSIVSAPFGGDDVKGTPSLV